MSGPALVADERLAPRSVVRRLLGRPELGAVVGAALAKVVKQGARPRFGVVHRHSAQNYELRYWLGACGMAPGRDVEVVVVLPPLMTDALKAGAIDGHCVAEP